MLQNTNKKNSNIINASEIGQYQYCSISWKLQRTGYKPDSKHIEAGIKNHITHGKIIEKIDKINQKLKILKIIGYISILIAVFIIFIEVIL